MAVSSAAIWVEVRKLPTWSVVMFRASRFMRMPLSSAMSAQLWRVSNMAQSLTVWERLS